MSLFKNYNTILDNYTEKSYLMLHDSEESIFLDIENFADKDKIFDYVLRKLTPIYFRDINSKGSNSDKYDSLYFHFIHVLSEIIDKFNINIENQNKFYLPQDPDYLPLVYYLLSIDFGVFDELMDFIIYYQKYSKVLPIQFFTKFLELYSNRGTLDSFIDLIKLFFENNDLVYGSVVQFKKDFSYTTFYNTIPNDLFQDQALKLKEILPSTSQNVLQIRIVPDEERFYQLLSRTIFIFVYEPNRKGYSAINILKELFQKLQDILISRNLNIVFIDIEEPIILNEFGEIIEYAAIKPLNKEPLRNELINELGFNQPISGNLYNW